VDWRRRKENHLDLQLVEQKLLIGRLEKSGVDVTSTF
jgi:hypothetical protein